MKRGALIAFSFGLALFIGILVWQGASAVLQALEVAGWGMLVVAAWHIVPLLFDSVGQWCALPAHERRLPRFITVLRSRWIGEGVNSLLPVAQVGGLIVMVRVLAQRGYPNAQAGAGVTVGTTQQMLAQAAFAIVGVALLGHLSDDPHLFWGLIAGIAVFLAICAWGYRAQRHGLFERLARILEKTFKGSDWLKLTGGAQALDAAVHETYKRRRRVVASFLSYFAGWIVGMGESWLALYFLDHRVGWLDALFLESLSQTIYAMAFAIPGALGVQEGGYVLLCGLIGVPADTAIAVSLIKRVRQLSLGLPALVSWQWFESRKLKRVARAAAHPELTADATPVSRATPVSSSPARPSRDS
ncbi:MAG TPA: lysylphosphatidylglycerol synthase domain-containing protein [Nevskiaceae bacterium]|nr:lysylphosphatidylglycerol synthase domain-containing protein [Nevskiaceae bacterium]